MPDRGIGPAFRCGAVVPVPGGSEALLGDDLVDGVGSFGFADTGGGDLTDLVEDKLGCGNGSADALDLGGGLATPQGAEISSEEMKRSGRLASAR